MISTADGRGTLFYMLGKEHVPPKIRRYYDGRLPVYTLIQVSLGVNADLSAEPHWQIRLLNQPLLIAGQEHTDIGSRITASIPA